MNNLFYPKLAADNLKKNSKTYIPYILTCIGTIIMYYIMYTLSVNKGLAHMSGGADLRMVLSLGNYVIAIFSVIFLFYTNSFLMKRRKKEFGIFNILGMEKRHLSKIILYETLYVAIISLSLGLLGGIILSKLMFLVLLRILNCRVTIQFEIPHAAIISSLILFCIIFILTLINSIRQIHLAKPIELIKGGQTGEKEPKTKWILTVIGVLALGSGYLIAVLTKEPLQALQLFFLAVILVIVGTYCLFTAGSIALLKILRKNKSYYYKTKHFISVSGMMYRMKQNAVGLANICILSTMVLVMLSTTVSLYLGSDDVIRTRYPRNIIVNSKGYSDEYRSGVINAVDGILKKHNLTAVNKLDLRYMSFLAIRKGNEMSTNNSKVMQINETSASLISLCFIPLEDYNRMTDSKVSLNGNEILLYSRHNEYRENTLSVLSKNFEVKKHLDKIPADFMGMKDIINTYYIVVKDISVMNELQKNSAKTCSKKAQPDCTTEYGFDLKADDKKAIAVTNDISAIIKTDYKNSYVDSAAESKASFYYIYGGLFFLGIFLGVLFIMATILIIYYKQISEGYEDKERFEIMQKVGMSLAEIKKTIHSQVLTVFFLPLVMAVIHIAFAFQVITKLLAILNLTNVTLFAYCTVGTIIIFAAFYGIIYAVTAKEYYKIVRQ